MCSYGLIAHEQLFIVSVPSCHTYGGGLTPNRWTELAFSDCLHTKLRVDTSRWAIHELPNPISQKIEFSLDHQLLKKNKIFCMRACEHAVRNN